MKGKTLISFDLFICTGNAGSVNCQGNVVSNKLIRLKFQLLKNEKELTFQA